jgi:hypothetical protein
MAVSDRNFRDLQVKTVLAYYEAARAELLERLNIRANIAVLYIAAIGSVAGYAMGDPSERFYLFVIVVPLLALGAATLWFQQDQAMDVLSKYCGKQLGPYIEKLWEERGEAAKPPKSIDQELFPPERVEQKPDIRNLFSKVKEVAFFLFIVPQLLVAPIGILIAFWREMGGGGRLTNLVPVWVIPAILVVGWLILLVLTIWEVIKSRYSPANTLK